MNKVKEVVVGNSKIFVEFDNDFTVVFTKAYNKNRKIIGWDKGNCDCRFGSLHPNLLCSHIVDAMIELKKRGIGIFGR